MIIANEVGLGKGFCSNDNELIVITRDQIRKLPLALDHSSVGDSPNSGALFTIKIVPNNVVPASTTNIK